MFGEEVVIEGEVILFIWEKNDQCGSGGGDGANDDDEDFSTNVLKFQHFPT